MLGHRTSGTGSGLRPDGVKTFHTPNTNGLDGGSNSRRALAKRTAWPTPTSSAMPCEGTQRIMRKKWLAGELSLEEASAIAGRDVRKAQGKVPEMWPTPRASENDQGRKADGMREGLSSWKAQGRGATLTTAVLRWPTPQASDNRPRGTQASTARRIAIGKQVGLEAMVKWTTPTAHNAKETNAPSESDRNTPTLAAQVGGQLNPTWVEWLMGWPLGWTDLNPLATAKSPSAPQQHSNY